MHPKRGFKKHHRRSNSTTSPSKKKFVSTRTGLLSSELHLFDDKAARQSSVASSGAAPDPAEGANSQMILVQTDKEGLIQFQ